MKRFRNLRLKELKENRARLLKAIEESGKTPDEIIALLKGE